MYEEKGYNIIFASGNYSYLVNLFKIQLTQKNCNLIEVNAKEPLKTINDLINGIIIYSDDAIISDATLLVYLKDFAEENHIPLFVVTDRTEEKELKNYLPDTAKIFERPINMREVTTEMLKIIDHDNFFSKKRILAIDDNPTMLRSIQNWLENDFNVSVATSGIAAIKQMAIFQPDIILLDYEMPVCNGNQVLKMLRSDEDTKNIPIIFLTNHTNAFDTIELMQYGVQGYILKTLPAAEIIQTIQQIVRTYCKD